ncbi:MAG TPA: hypothetical protein VNV60_02350, partial [Holophagaceae bacterium]|nr:hypothetical protein [Holophagaceae bacterium]
GLWAGGAVPADAPAGSGSGARVAPAVPYSGRSEDEVLLVELRLRYQTLSESFPVYPIADGTFIPLGALCHELELGVRVDPIQARAEGFIISESRKFLLDVRAQRVELNGKALPFIPSQIEIHPDDIYVDARLVAQWLPVDIQVDRLRALMTVTPREPLPIEQAQDRFRHFGSASRRPADRRVYNEVPDPYQWIEVPMVDETLRFVYAQSSTPKFQAQSSTFAAGDLLAMTGKAYFNIGQDGQTVFRGSLGRTNPDPVLLGPLQARQFAFGDVLDPGLALVSSPSAGTGAYVTNYPENQWVQSQKRTFRGDLPQGWQVELYQNGALMGLQTSQADGTYEFRDVPLQFGWNDFRLEFYGPQGQRRQESMHVDAEQPLAPQGEFRYLLSTDRPYSLNGGRGQLMGAYGFTRSTSGFAALSSIDLPGSFERYGVAGIQTNWDYLTGRFTGTVQKGGGSALEASLSSRIAGLSIVATRDELQNNFFSEIFQPSPTFIRSRTSLDLSGALPSLDRPWVSLGLSAKRDEFVNGGVQDQIAPRIGLSVAGWFLSNSAIIQHNAFPSSPSSTTAYGDFLASRQLGSWSLRGDAIYTFDGPQGRALQSLAAYVNTLRFQPWSLQLGLLHSTRGGGDTVQASATKSFGRVGISIDTSWSTASHWTAGVSLRMNLAREPRSGRWQASAQSSALQGAASGLAFTDANNNGRMDPGETPIADAAFLVNGLTNATRTGANGVAFVRNLPTDQYVKVATSQQSLSDPFMEAPAEGWRFLPRPGHTTLIGAAVVMTGDINGTVYLIGPAGAKVAQAGVSIELVDDKGRVVAQTRSSYDGYYDLGSLKPGTFQLRLDAKDLDALGAAMPAAKTLTLLPTGTELDGVDWILNPIQKPDAPVPEKAPAEPTVQTAAKPAAPTPVPSPAEQAPPAQAPKAQTQAPTTLVQDLTPAHLRAVVLHGDPAQAAQLSKAWLAHTDLKGWAVRAQIGALPATLLEAAEYLDPKDGAILLRPWALANGQCARQFFVAGFRTRAAAQRYASHLRVNKQLDPPTVVPVKELMGAEPPCSFYAE